MVRLRFVIFLFAISWLGTSAHAEDWVSPDGAVSVTRPDASRFVDMQLTPPMTAGWISQDETTKLGVMEMELPRGISLRQKSLEEGFAKQMQGRITRSDVRNDGEHTIYIMSAQGTMLGIKVAATQSVVAVGNTGYKAMAFVLGDDARETDEARQFVESLKVLRSPGLTNIASAESPPTEDKTALVIAERSLGIGAYLLLLCVLYAIVVLLIRKFGGQRLKGWQQWINVYSTVAVAFLFAAVAGCRENVRQIIAGVGLPPDPNARTAYIVGMFGVPLLIGVLAIVLFVLARRKVQRWQNEMPQDRVPP